MVLFLTLQRYLLKESFDFIVVVLSKVVLIAFDLDVQLLNPDLLWFFRLYFQFS